MAILPLSEASRARFDEKAAIEFFKSIEGLPFGYHTFLWGWFDTAFDNLPPLVPPQLFPFAWDMVDRFLPDEVNILFT